jgi:hypothetical protein
MSEASIPKRVGPKTREVSTPIPLPVAKDLSKHQDSARRSILTRSRTAAKRDMLEKAAAELRRQGTVMRARDLIAGQSLIMKQVYLLAEEYDQNRKDVLSVFPPVSSQTRKTYTPRGYRSAQTVAS